MANKSDLRNKVTKELPEFVAEVNTLTTAQIDNRLADLAKFDSANEDAKEDDEEYQAAKALVSEMSAPYRDARKVIKLKSKYLVMLLKDRGSNA